jgi:hypothetical protein
VSAFTVPDEIDHRKVGRPGNSAPPAADPPPAPWASKASLTFAQIPHEATGLSLRSYQVLGICHGRLGGFRKNRNTIDLTDAEIARRARCTIGTVQRALHELELAGWIQRDRRHGKRRITRLFSLAGGDVHAISAGAACNERRRSAPAAPPGPPSCERANKPSSSARVLSDDDLASLALEKPRAAGAVTITAPPPELPAGDAAADALDVALQPIREAHGDDQAEAIKAKVPGLEARLRAENPRLELAYIRACILAAVSATAAKKPGSFTKNPAVYFAAIAPRVPTEWTPAEVKAALERSPGRADPARDALLADVKTLKSYGPGWHPDRLRQHVMASAGWTRERFERAAAELERPVGQGGS